MRRSLMQPLLGKLQEETKRATVAPIVWGLACRWCISRSVKYACKRWGNQGSVCIVLLLSVGVEVLGYRV